MSKTKNKKEAEKFQHQLLDLLKEDANRVCADCRARGPRWASWNLGKLSNTRCTFLLITCPISHTILITFLTQSQYPRSCIV